MYTVNANSSLLLSLPVCFCRPERASSRHTSLLLFSGKWVCFTKWTSYCVNVVITVKLQDAACFPRCVPRIWELLKYSKRSRKNTDALQHCDMRLESPVHLICGCIQEIDEYHFKGAPLWVWLGIYVASFFLNRLINPVSVISYNLQFDIWNYQH